VYCTNSTLGNLHLHREVDLSNSQFTFYCSQRVDIQNQSKAVTTATGGHEDVANRLNIHSQPVTGKKYTFKNGAVDVHDMLHQASGDFDFLEDATPQTGNLKGINASSASVTNSLGSIPRARSLFKNCALEGNVYMPPGSVKKFNTTFKFKGSLKQFFYKFSRPNGIAKRAYGGITYFAMQRAIKHGDSDLELAFNRHIKAYSYCKLRSTKHMLRDVVQED
jgi:hypothetical protein